MACKRVICGLVAMLMALMLLPVGRAAAAGEGENEAKIGDTEYATLEAAFESAKAGNTITLLTDVADAAITVETDNLTLDLNGKTLSGEKHPGTDGSSGGSSTTPQPAGKIVPAALTIGTPYTSMGTEINSFTVTNGTISTGTGIRAYKELKNLTVTGVTFKDNAALNANQKEAGAAVNYDLITGETVQNTSATFTNCVFENNQSEYNNGSPLGGAVSVSNVETVVFTNCDFNGNKSAGTDSNGAGNAVGGAVYLSYCGNIRMTGCDFDGNSSGSGSGGGALHTMWCGETTITGCTFTNNKMNGGSGGAIALTYSTADMNTISDNTFIGNIADSNGGAIWIAKANVTIEDNTYTNNTGANGGILMVQNASNVIFNDDISNSSASNVGGFAYIAGDVDLTITGNITNNTAGGNGGAIYAQWTTEYGETQYTGIPDITINGNMNGNTATTDGGAIYAKLANITVNGSMQNNEAGRYGGGIYTYSYDGFDMKTDFSNAAVYNNTATAAGDDIYNATANSTITLPTIGQNWVLSSCSHLIDGWYDDSANNRWNGDSDPIHAEKVEAAAQTGVAALKAAHGANPTEVPTVVKTAGGSDSFTAAQPGDLVPFTLKVTVPKYTSTLTITDTMEGMSLEGGSVYVTMNGGLTSVPVEVTATGFTLTLENLFSAEDKTITVSYNARVDQDAEAGAVLSNTVTVDGGFGGGSDTVTGSLAPEGEDEDRGDPYLKINKLWSGDDETVRPDAVQVNVYHEEDLYRTVTIYEKYEWMGGTYIPAEWEDDYWWVEEANLPEEYDSVSEEVRHLVFDVTNTYNP